MPTRPRAATDRADPEQHATVIDLTAARSPAAPSAIASPPIAAVGARRALLDARGASESRPTVRRLIWRQGWSRVRLIVDVIVLAVATGAATASSAMAHLAASPRPLATVFPLSVLMLMHGRRGPDDRLCDSILETIMHVIGAASVAGTITIALYAVTGTAHGVATALLLLGFISLYLSVARAALMNIRRRALRMHKLSQPTLIIGAGAVGDSLARRLLDEPCYGLRPVGYLDADPASRPTAASNDLPVFGGPEAVPEAVARTGASHVIVAFSSKPDHMLVQTVRACEQLGVTVSLIPRLYESINGRSTLDHIGGLPLVTLRPTDPRGWQFAVKHGIDRIGAAVALLALSVLLGAIAIAVRLDSPGPILFRQRRVGRDGHEFDLLKFRTMREPAQRPRYFELPPGVAPGGVEGEDRRTRVGRLLRRLSLDELPQLINVLRGDMSLIGPRPERPEYVQRFARDVAHYEDRHRVKSGMTGWAQVHGLRGQTAIAERVELDNYYIQNWSLRLDLQIMLLTIAEVLRFRG
jgi:exopolysaccharide biosynthesis polyprenyl glycosylphosphotransferase